MIMYRVNSRVLPSVLEEFLEYLSEFIHYQLFNSLFASAASKFPSIWENNSLVEYWKHTRSVPTYQEISTFMLKLMVLPQSTPEDERIFSKVIENSMKLQNKFLL